MKIFPSQADLAERSTPLTVDELARSLYPTITYDCALPQQWVDAVTDHGFDPRGQVVWGYPPESKLMGQPLPLTTEAVVALSRLARSIQ